MDGGVKGEGARIDAGCDGALSGNQYAETLARMVPEESIVLTLGCAKYRLRGLISGEIDGVPRLIDVGQCTDFVAVPALLETLGCALDLPMEQVPLSIYFAWHGQTSVAILLALLAAGFRDIRFGPVPPAFLTPAMREIMERLFALRPAVTPQTDFPEAFRKKTER